MANFFRILGATIALGLLSGAMTAGAETPPQIAAAPLVPAAPDAINNRFLSGVAKYNQNDLSGAKTELQTVIRDPAFDALPPQGRYRAYIALAWTELAQKNYDDTYKHAQKAGNILPDGRDADYWALIAQSAWGLQKTDEAKDALFVMARTYPDRMSLLYPPSVFGTLDQLGQSPPQKGVRLELAEALWKARYVPRKGWDAQRYWVWLFTTWADAGQDDKAREIAPALTNPQDMMWIEVDNRYNRFADAMGGQEGFVKRVNDGLITVVDLPAGESPRLQDVTYQIRWLRYANHLDESLTVIDDTLAKATNAPPDKPAFKDTTELLPWIYEEREKTLILMGRTDEALAAGRDALKTAMDTKLDMVSQAINLAGVYTRAGQPKVALTLLGDRTAMNAMSSQYGEVAAENERLCASAELGDTKRVQQALDFVRHNGRNDYQTLRHAMICANDMDGLAKLTIAKLDDPKTRGDVLIRLQTYLPEPVLSDFDGLIQQRAKDLLARDDVRAAIAKYGVIKSYPVYDPF
jgi:tetratricopeptide (TPR) repeat protein